MNSLSVRSTFGRKWLTAFALAFAGALSICSSGCDFVGASATTADDHDEHAADADSHAGHGHEQSAHDDPNHLDLSPQAQRNIGLKIGPVALKSFERVITIPSIVVERPGRTSVAVAAPLSGVVDEIVAVEGEAVSPGERLFDIRLTHEEIVQAQGEFLKAAVELEVVGREVARLTEITAEGAIAGKTLLQRKYEQEKQQAVLQAQREALLLHGLSDDQVDAILRDKKLLQGLTVHAPQGRSQEPGGTRVKGRGSRDKIVATIQVQRTHTSGPRPLSLDSRLLVWQIQELRVKPGQHVTAGDTLAVLADYRTLYIEGSAFEQDAREIVEAVKQDWPMSAVVDAAGSQPLEIPDLKVAYTSGLIDPDSRTFRFYVTLPNEKIRDATNDQGDRFIDWQFKPGQRLDLRVPVERWNDRLVLPIDAVARDGAESYVFQVNGNSFLRRPVHEEYRDPLWVVVANDGSIFPGDFVALSGAQQMQIAIKNKMGGGVDAHAGHAH